MTSRHHDSGLSAIANQTLHTDLSPGQFFDLLVLGCALAAFGTSLLSMGGAAPVHAEAPLRWCAAALALHGYAMYRRRAEGKGRLRLHALIPFAFVALFIGDALIHPATAWKAYESAAFAAIAASLYWVTVHHTRHSIHRWFVYLTLGTITSVFGLFTLGGENLLVTKFAGRTVDPVYAGHATGPFGTPGEFAALMLLGLLPAITLLILPTGKIRHRVFAAYFAGVIGAGLWKCGLAGGLFGAVAGIATLLVLRVRHRYARVAIGIGAVALLSLIAAQGKFDGGLSRAVFGAAPLKRAALDAFSAHPALGTGTGGFADWFESVRPAGWFLDPETAGGFFHQLLAEHGLAGILIWAASAILFLTLTWRAVAALPLIKTSYDRQFDKTTRFSPEPSIAMIAVASALVAATASMAFDYPRSNLSLAIAFALLAGTVARDLFGEKFSTNPTSADSGLSPLRIAACATPAMLLLLLGLPVLRGRSTAGFASDYWSRVAPSADPGGKAPAPEVRLAALELTIDTAEQALRYTPGDADNRARLAAAITLRYNLTANPAGLGRALTCARLAAAARPASPRHVLPLVELLRIYGRAAEATATVDTLYAHAPRHPAALLEYTRTHLADRAARGHLRAALQAQAIRMPEDAETRRLLRLMELADA